MIVPSEEKLNDAFPPGSSVAIEHHVSGSTEIFGDSTQQQTYAPSSESPFRNDYEPELPPPAYGSVTNPDPSTSNVDVKSEPTTAREVSSGPSTEAEQPIDDTQTTYEPFAESSAYARPLTVAQIPSPTSSGPPDYTVPSMTPSPYPPYPSPGSFDCPPPSAPPPRNLLSFVGGCANSSSQNRNPVVPPSFSRPLPLNLYYNTFPPTYLIANDKHLDGGFPVVPPPSPVQPHPFSSRDVREVDWIRFLRDLKKTATLTSGERATAGALAVFVPGIFTGLYVANSVRKSMKSKKGKPVGELVDSWNYYFFHPRRLEIILARGQDRIDSGEGPVPALDPQIERMGLRLRRTSSRSSSSSPSSSRSSSSSPCREDEGKRKRKGKDRERKREKAGRGRGNRKQYRLFVVGL